MLNVSGIQIGVESTHELNMKRRGVEIKVEVNGEVVIKIETEFEVTWLVQQSGNVFLLMMVGCIHEVGSSCHVVTYNFHV